MVTRKCLYFFNTKHNWMSSLQINYLVIVGKALKRQASKRGSNIKLHQSLSSNFKNTYGECPVTVHIFEAV